MKAIIYTRFSPRPNADESESCEKQKEVCEAYCQKNGYRIVGYFEDRECSGDDVDREGLWAAVDAIKRGYVLVVRWRSRLARDMLLNEVIERDVETAGGTIEAAEEDNGQSDMDKLMRHILAAFRVYEKKAAAARTKRAMLKYQNEDRRIMSKRLPYGWITDPDDKKKMIECPDEQRVLSTITKLKEVGLSDRGIANRLNEMECKPRIAKQWSHQTIKAILDRQTAQSAS